MKTHIKLILALVAGSIMPIQLGMPVQLVESVQQPVFAEFPLFLTGIMGLIIIRVL
ncbi:uncharacterized membrane protein YdcZ (DUF606 family) [Algoriphagus sp. 4150]|uniref:DMT family transporter n=1 Tax=Algoriphagus sp. 4150 TaxID=2817756 RepID=UPI0028656F80|nr:DMT family transporter [Algoriphagus sp. 4150]MDR7127958.1 uncharacterized membrane protein YdcZ (DUF606 family) [Algoriphagus sp. 4150]